MNSGFGSTFSSGLNGINWRKILTGVIFIILIYIAYNYYINYLSGTKTLNGFNNAMGEVTIADNNIPQNSGALYSYSIWFFVKEWNTNYGQEKILFVRNSADNKNGPKVMFDTHINTVKVILTYHNPSNTGTSDFTCEVPNVPIQNWTNLIMSLDGRSLDIYLQGKLVKTCVLPGVPVSVTGPVKLTPSGKGFSGFTSDFKYFSYSVNPQEAYDIYKSGFSGSSMLGNLLNRFKLRFTILKNEEVINQFDI